MPRPVITHNFFLNIRSKKKVENQYWKNYSDIVKKKESYFSVFRAFIVTLCIEFSVNAPLHIVILTFILMCNRISSMLCSLSIRHCFMFDMKLEIHVV